MAEHIRMKQVPGGTVSAVDDRILYDVNLSCGIIEGCEISYPGNNMIHINAGYGIIKGGLFEMDDHTIYVDYAEAGEVTGQVYLHFDPAAEDKLIILYETTPTLHQMEQNEDCNYHNKVYEIQLCTFTATTTALLNVEQTWVRATGAVEVLDNLNEIMANTDANKCAGALAVKQLNSNLTANDGLNFRFGKDGDGNYGFYRADGSLIPFKKGITIVNLGDSNSLATRTFNVSWYKDYNKLTINNFYVQVNSIGMYENKEDYGTEGKYYDNSNGILTVGRIKANLRSSSTNEIRAYCNYTVFLVY